MKVIKAYAKNILKINSIYKWHIFIKSLYGIFNVVAMLFIWYVVYTNSGKENIDGYSFNSIILYTIMANLTATIIHLKIDHLISNEVKSGEITNSFIRPISYINKLIGEALGDIIYNIISLFLPIILLITIYAYIYNINFEITLKSVTLYILSVIFSIVINFEINILVGFCSFYVNYIWGFIMLKNSMLMLMTGELFPISFYPNIVIEILKFTPFYYINYGPVSILLNKFSSYYSLKIIIIQIIWSLILGILVNYVWNKSKAKLQINGG